MSRFATILGTLPSCLVLALVLPPTAAQQPEASVDCIVEPVQIAYGQHSSCSLSPTTDIDTFEFAGVQGERVRFIVDAMGNHDPCLKVLDPVGAWVDVGAGATGIGYCCTDGCAFVAEVTLGVTGDYLVIVEEWGHDETGTYLLEIERLPPLSSPPPALILNVPVSDVLNHTTDHDFFAFAANAGDLMHLAVDAMGNHDLYLEILDPSGLPLNLGGTCGAALCCVDGCALAHSWSVAQSGTHTVILSEWGLDEVGSYDISLQCFFGTCPPPPFQPYGVGLAGTGGLEPKLSGAGVPQLGGSVTINVSDGLASTGGVMVASPGQAHLPIFGGAVLVFPFAIVDMFVLDPGGAGGVTYTIPLMPALVGVPFYAQAGFLDPGAVQGVSMTHGLKLTIIQ